MDLASLKPKPYEVRVYVLEAHNLASRDFSSGVTGEDSSY
jgi:hypothetical protein